MAKFDWKLFKAALHGLFRDSEKGVAHFTLPNSGDCTDVVQPALIPGRIRIVTLRLHGGGWPSTDLDGTFTGQPTSHSVPDL